MPAIEYIIGGKLHVYTARDMTDILSSDSASTPKVLPASRLQRTLEFGAVNRPSQQLQQSASFEQTPKSNLQDGGQEIRQSALARGGSRANRQWHEAIQLARCAHDQPEELLHVRDSIGIAQVTNPVISFPGPPDYVLFVALFPFF
jgi:hypothetical protein